MAEPTAARPKNAPDTGPSGDPAIRAAADRAPRPMRDGYRWFLPITTRWMDNDRYGHVNNVVYYSFYDTAVNRMLMEHGLLDPEAGALIGLVVETQCRFHAPIAFPDQVEAGVRIARIGNTSVRYETALFRAADLYAAADGHFVHVYVDRVTRRPATLPDHWRRRLERFKS